MATMCGWARRAIAWASWAKRSANAVSRPISGGRIFSAATRLSFFWRALYTAPMPPRPISSRMSSSGNRGASSSGAGGVQRADGAEGSAALPSVLASSPRLRRHFGQWPLGLPVGSGAPHSGHRVSLFMVSSAGSWFGFVYPLEKQAAGEVTNNP